MSIRCVKEEKDSFESSVKEIFCEIFIPWIVLFSRSPRVACNLMFDGIVCCLKP